MGEISTITLLDGVTYDIKDAKSRMTILKYGSSTWDDFITAYNNKAIVYCRASSNSNPATGSQTRLAFMAYVNNETTPTEVEFQYYRSVSSHSDSQQGDQVYVYKLNKTTGWSVTTRNAFTKVIAGTGLTSSFTTGTSSSITLSFDTADASDIVYDNTASGLSSTSVQGAIDEVASDIDKSNAVFINFSATGHFLDEEYEITDGWWTFDSITDADGNSLTYTDLFSAFQDGKNIFLNATSAIGTSYFHYKNIPISGVDVTVTDPDTSYYISFDFVDGTSSDQSTWRIWAVIYNDTDPVIYRIDVDGSDADNIRYSNTSSGLTATDVQNAIDEISTVAGLTDTNISSPTEGQILHYDQTNSKWVNDKTASGSFSIFPTTSEDAAIQVTGDASHSANVGVYNRDIAGTMHLNMDTLGAKELVVYDSNGNRSTVVGQDASGNYFGDVFSAIDTKIDTAGTGLSKSGTTLNHSNSITAGTAGTSSATSGSTLAVPYVTYDAQGHITAKGTHTHTVTGFVATSSLPISIANGGTGQTTRLDALKALTNEGVGTNATYFLTITNNWGKGGYTSVADVKTVLGLGSAAYKNSTTTLSASQTGLIQSNTVFNNLMYKPGDIIRVTGMVLTGYLTNAGKTMKFYFPVSKPISSTVSSAVLNCDNIEIRGISGYIDSSGSAITGDTLIINASRNGFIWQDVATTAHKIKDSTTNYPNNTPLTLVLYDDGTVNATIKLT